MKLVHSRGGHSTWNSGWIHYMQNRVHHIVLESPAIRTWDGNIRRRRRRRKRRKRKHKVRKKETGKIEKVRLGKNTEARRRRVKKKRNEEEDVATGQSPRDLSQCLHSHTATPDLCKVRTPMSPSAQINVTRKQKRFYLLLSLFWLVGPCADSSIVRRTDPDSFFSMSLFSFYFLTYMLTEKEPTIFQWRHRHKSVRVEGCEAARLAKCYVEAHQTSRIYSRGVTKHLCCPVVLRSCLSQARLLLICLFFHRFLSSFSSMLLRDTILAFVCSTIASFPYGSSSPLFEEPIFYLPHLLVANYCAYSSRDIVDIRFVREIKISWRWDII